MTAFDVTLADIEAARERIAGRVRRTPAFPSAATSAQLGRTTVLKLEALQDAGSFKVRGVFNKVMSLTEEERRRGLVTTSGGNHAIAVATVAGAMGIDALVLMPKVTPRFNVELTQSLGAAVELCEDARKPSPRPTPIRRKGACSSPLRRSAIIAGHGTLGLELLEDAPDLTHVFVSIGGGGFMAGVAAALKARSPGITIYGVETTGAPTMTKALEAGEPVTIRPTSIARTLGAPFATRRTLAAAQSFLQEIVLVEDAPAVADLAWILQAEKVLCEPAAACTLTAARRIAPDLPGDAKVGLVLCGSNVSLHDVDAWRRDFAGPTP
jgi:threonine dehydratase